MGADESGIRKAIIIIISDLDTSTRERSKLRGFYLFLSLFFFPKHLKEITHFVIEPRQFPNEYFMSI